MGGCLFRRNNINNKRENIQLYYQLSQNSETTNYIDELENIKDIENLKNCEILQITQMNHKCVIIKKPSLTSYIYKVLEIQGSGNTMQSCNYFVGAVTLNGICYLMVRIMQGLAAQVSVQEMQCLDIGENIQYTIKTRFEEKFICVGVIYLEDLVILIFRQFLLKIQCPIIEQFQTFDQNTTCIIQYDNQLYQLKKQI